MKRTSRKEGTKIKHNSALKKDIGLRFKRFRQSLGKSQKQLADFGKLEEMKKIAKDEIKEWIPMTEIL